MGVSGGGGSSSRSGAALKWTQPYRIDAVNDVQGVYDTNQPATQSNTNTLNGLVPGLVNKYNAGDPALNASENYTTSTLGHDPYAGSSQLENLINISRGHALDAVGAKYGSHGSFGGTPWATAAARGAMEAETGLRYQDVQNNQHLQQSAAGMAPQQAAAGYLGITPLLNTATTAAGLPYTGTTAEATSLAQLLDGSKSKTKGPSLLQQLSGAASAGAQAYAAGGG